MQSNAGGNAMMMYEDASRASAGVYYPMDMETKLMAALHEGGHEGCEALLEEIKLRNESRSGASPLAMRGMRHAMMHTASRVCDVLQLEDKSPLSIGFRALESSVDSEALFEEILRSCQLVCGQIRKNSEMKNKRFICHAVRHIQYNSGDPSLSLDVIAKKFDVSYHHLSHLFNEVAGQRFTDILNKSRIERALRLLDETGETVQSVCAKSGFTCLNTFLRAFRKETDLTPSAYRKLGRKADLIEKRGSGQAGIRAARHRRGCWSFKLNGVRFLSISRQR
jgi:YesN/AraC family two-component response regulator